MLSLVDLVPLYPELLLVAVSLGLLILFGVSRDNNLQHSQVAHWISIGALLCGVVLLASQPEQTVRLFDDTLVVDRFARFVKGVILLGSAVSLLLSIGFFQDVSDTKFEYCLLLLLATCGMLVMVSANDLIILYLGLELQSLALYVLAAIRRELTKSTEAGLKYFVLGALSSGMLLYGASLIYGFSGSTHFSLIADVVRTPDASLNFGLIIGMVFFLVGMAFKISAVPFHMWVPDVYEGAPTPVTAFFAAVPKIAAMALLIRVVFGAFQGLQEQWQQIVVFLSISSMILGSFAAIGQVNLKRLMAYSSIGHVGFALVGLAAGTPEGVQSILIYLVIYSVATLGTFACLLSVFRSGGRRLENIDDLAGLAQNNLPIALAFAVFMFSFAGIPPLAGFFAKLYVFSAAVKEGLYALVVLGLLSSVVASYYYVRIVKIIFMDSSDETFFVVGPGARLIVMLAGAFVVAFCLRPWLLVDLAAVAAGSLRL